MVLNRYESELETEKDLNDVTHRRSSIPAEVRTWLLWVASSLTFGLDIIAVVGGQKRILCSFLKS